MNKTLLAILLSLLSCTMILAAPARRTSQTYQQPDGTSITVVYSGDEFFCYYATTDGVMVVQNTDGAYYYARLLADGTITPTSRIAHNAAERSLEEQSFIAGLSHAEPATYARARAQAQTRANYLNPPHYVSKQNQKILVILVEFSDVKFGAGKQTYDVKAEFTKRFNADNYQEDGVTGSVRQYFIAQSDSIFIPDFHVVGPVTLDETMAYYGARSGSKVDIRAGQMIKDACAKVKANNLVPDFSIYDLDNDGEIDVVNVIYAGYGDNVSGNEDAVWPHKWDLVSAGVGRYEAQSGVYFNTYCCTCERFGNNANDRGIDGPGTFCHEFSHILGLPDFYDTRDVSQPWFGMDMWSVMDSGCYYGNGKTPCGYSAYERDFMGWMDITTLPTVPASLSLATLSQSKDAYKIVNDANNNEYFILENRQRIGWDAAFYGGGMMITYVDYNASYWTGNRVNSGDRERFTIIPADGDKRSRDHFASSVVYAENLRGDLFPGTTNRAAFNPYEYLNAKDGLAADWNRFVSNIKEESGVITFDFMKDDPVGCTKTAIDNSFSVYTTAGQIVIYSQTEKPAYLYSIDGILMQTISLSEGENNVSAAPGLYLIRVGNEAMKVSVK